jgi:hypothetical protein
MFAFYALATSPDLQMNEQDLLASDDGGYPWYQIQSVKL